MQGETKGRRMPTGMAVLFLWGMCLTASHAQTTANGQVLSPGAPGGRTATGCSAQDPNTATSAAGTASPNCVDAGPGFVTPSTNMPVDKGHSVMSLVRVDSVIPRPPVTLPEGDTFSTVGSATLIRLRRPALEACLATGRRISARANAGTSTTCLDPKGDVLAYQECRAGSTEAGGCTVLTPQDIAKQQVAAKTP